MKTIFILLFMAGICGAQLQSPAKYVLDQPVPDPNDQKASANALVMYALGQLCVEYPAFAFGVQDDKIVIGDSAQSFSQVHRDIFRGKYGEDIKSYYEWLLTDNLKSMFLLVYLTKKMAKDSCCAGRWQWLEWVEDIGAQLGIEKLTLLETKKDIAGYTLRYCSDTISK